DRSRAVGFDCCSQAPWSGVIQIRHLVDPSAAPTDRESTVALGFGKCQMTYTEPPHLTGNNAVAVHCVDSPLIGTPRVELEVPCIEYPVLELARVFGRIAGCLRDGSRIGAEINPVRPGTNGGTPGEDRVFGSMFIVIGRIRLCCSTSRVGPVDLE